MTSPPSVVLWPAAECPPLLTASSSPNVRATVDDPGDVVRPADPDDGRGPPIDGPGQDDPGRSVRGVVRRDDPAVERGSELGDGIRRGPGVEVVRWSRRDSPFVQAARWLLIAVARSPGTGRCWGIGRLPRDQRRPPANCASPSASWRKRSADQTSSMATWVMGRSPSSATIGHRVSRLMSARPPLG